MTTPKKKVPNKRIADETKPNPLEVSLSPAMRAVADGAGNITMEDIESLKDFHITDTDAKIIAASDILEITDVPEDPIIGHLVFRWLSPARRASVGMHFWQWVKGDLAKLVREKGIVKEAIGGGASTSVIVNGDLMLAFAPRQAHTERKNALKRHNAAELDSIADKSTLESALHKEYQRVDRDVSIRKKYGQSEDYDG